MSDRKLTLAVDFVGADRMSATARTISVASKAAAQQIGALKGQLASLNSGLANAKALRAATENLKKHKAATQDAAAKLAALKGQIQSGEAPTAKLVRQIQAASQNLTKMQGAEKTATDSTRQMIATMRSAGVDVARLGTFERETATKIDQTTRALERQKSILTGTKTRMAELRAAEKKAGAASAGTSRRGGDDAPDEGQDAASRLGKMSVSTHGLMSKGKAILDVVENAADVGADFQALSYRLSVSGLSDKAVKELEDYARGMNVAGSSARDNMRYIVEAQGAFRESGEHNIEEQLAGAKKMAPLMAKLMVTSKALGQELSQDQESYFLRFVEQSGGLNDPKRAAELTDSLFRALISSGGNVNPANYQGFLTAAGTSGMHLSSRSVFADFEPLVGELHEQAGVGLAKAYSRMNGMVKDQAAMRELIRLGAWDKNKIIFNRVDGIKAFRNGENPLLPSMSASLKSSPVDFYLELRKLYQARGVKDIERENAMLFGGSGGKLFNLIEKQLPTIMKSRAAYDQTKSLEDSHTMVMGGLLGQREALHAETDNFNLSLAESGSVVDGFTATLKHAAEILHWSTTHGPGDMFSSASPQAAPPPPVNWRSVDLSRTGGPMALPTITPMSPASINPAFFQQPRGPVTINVHPPAGASATDIAKETKRLIYLDDAQRGRSTYNGGR